MNLLNLRYFLVAAEELNFTRAARRLYISQQSLSGHILKLENYFGVELFDRSPPMTLTSAGTCLMRYAKRMLDSVDELEKEVQDIKGSHSGELTIGITRARGAVYLPMILPKFNRDFPNIKIHLIEENSAHLEQLLREGKIDLMLGRVPKDILGIDCEVVWREQYVIIVPNNFLQKYLPDRADYLCAHPEEATLKDFEDCPFLSSRMNQFVGEAFHNCCARANMDPHVILEAYNINIVIALCLEGMGALVCPNALLHPYLGPDNQFSNRDISIFPIDYYDEIAVSFLRNKYVSSGMREFIRLIRSISNDSPFS